MSQTAMVFFPNDSGRSIIVPPATRVQAMAILVVTRTIRLSISTCQNSTLRRRDRYVRQRQPFEQMRYAVLQNRVLRSGHPQFDGQSLAQLAAGLVADLHVFPERHRRCRIGSHVDSVLRKQQWRAVKRLFRAQQMRRHQNRVLGRWPGLRAVDLNALPHCRTVQPPSFVSIKAVRKPKTVIRPAQLRASSKASGIIVSASMASIAPAATAVIAAMKSPDAPRNPA
jgi:hypothetical protein